VSLYVFSNERSFFCLLFCFSLSSHSDRLNGPPILLPPQRTVLKEPPRSKSPRFFRHMLLSLSSPQFIPASLRFQGTLTLTRFLAPRKSRLQTEAPSPPHQVIEMIRTSSVCIVKFAPYPAAIWFRSSLGASLSLTSNPSSNGEERPSTFVLRTLPSLHYCHSRTGGAVF